VAANRNNEDVTALCIESFERLMGPIPLAQSQWALIGRAEENDETILASLA
jgi:hypothetical protein